MSITQTIKYYLDELNRDPNSLIPLSDLIVLLQGKGTKLSGEQIQTLNFCFPGGLVPLMYLYDPKNIAMLELDRRESINYRNILANEGPPPPAPQLTIPYQYDASWFSGNNKVNAFYKAPITVHIDNSYEANIAPSVQAKTEEAFIQRIDPTQSVMNVLDNGLLTNKAIIPFIPEPRIKFEKELFAAFGGLFNFEIRELPNNEDVVILTPIMRVDNTKQIIILNAARPDRNLIVQVIGMNNVKDIFTFPRTPRDTFLVDNISKLIKRPRALKFFNEPLYPQVSDPGLREMYLNRNPKEVPKDERENLLNFLKTGQAQNGISFAGEPSLNNQGVGYEDMDVNFSARKDKTVDDEEFERRDREKALSSFANAQNYKEYEEKDKMNNYRNEYNNQQSSTS